MVHPKLQPHDFRDVRRDLPQEKKGVLERQINAAEAVRQSIVRALEKPNTNIPDSLLKRLTRAGQGSHDLAIKLRALTLQKAPQEETPASQGGGLIEEAVRGWQEEWERLGGSTREAQRRVLEKMDLTGYWYELAFNHWEEFAVFERRLFADLPVPPSKVRCLDLGCGASGRASRLALKALENLYGEDKARLIARNLTAVDLIPKNVASTQTALAPWGVKDKNVRQGDFFENFPPELQRGDIHFIWAPMHTSWYAVTERDLMKLLRNIERAAADGALIMFDTVGLFNLEGVPPTKRVVQYDDLADFYPVLVRRERERIFDGMAHPLGRIIPRYPIIDVAPGSGEEIYREVLTKEYINYLLKQIGSSLRFKEHFPIGNTQLDSHLPPEKRMPEAERLQKAEALGLQWIRDNHLEEDLKADIAFREKQIREGKKQVLPLYAYSKEERAALVSPEDLVMPIVEQKLKMIAQRMVLQFEQRYLIYAKDPSDRKSKKAKKRG